MSAKIAVTLELTTHEAETLQCLLMKAVHWAGSGEFGLDVRAVYMALSGEGFYEARYAPRKGLHPDQRDWVKADM